MKKATLRSALEAIDVDLHLLQLAIERGDPREEIRLRIEDMRRHIDHVLRPADQPAGGRR